MEDCESIANEGDSAPNAAFDVRRAARAGEAAPTPLVFASPHSGRDYPDDMRSVLDPRNLRLSEDAFVDDLIEAAPAMGVSVIAARLGRAYIDMNREAFELDPAMFADELPAHAKPRTARVAAGLGSIAKVVAEGKEIYARKLMYAEARDRIEGAHRPYHAALEQLLEEARAAHGFAVLIDWHSMPAAAARGTTRERPCDMVLGDRFGAACSNLVTSLVERELEAMGYRLARNAPYAGGYTTEHYGRPAQGVHALQIEINRGLYLDEKALKPTAGFAALKTRLEALTRTLAATDWAELAP